MSVRLTIRCDFCANVICDLFTLYDKNAKYSITGTAMYYSYFEDEHLCYVCKEVKKKRELKTFKEKMSQPNLGE